MTAIGEEMPHLIGRQAVEQRDIEREIIEIKQGECCRGYECRGQEAVIGAHARIVTEDLDRKSVV